MSSWLKEQERFANLREPALRGTFAEQIHRATLPVATALLHDLAGLPSALLCGLDLGASFGASFTWRDPVIVEPKLPTALWQDDRPEHPKKQVIEIRCRVNCLFCDAPLVSAERTLSSTSEYELVCKVAVVPMCPTCIGKSNENPNYWRECLSRLASGERRALKGVPGGGQGDGKPRGSIRLVKNEDPEG